MAGQSGATLLAGLDAKLSFTRIFYFFYFLTLLRRLFTPLSYIRSIQARILTFAPGP